MAAEVPDGDEPAQTPTQPLTLKKRTKREECQPNLSRKILAQILPFRVIIPALFQFQSRDVSDVSHSQWPAADVV